MMTLVVMSTFVAVAAVTFVTSTPLDDYVNAPDPTYSYKYLTQYPVLGGVVHVLNMTSQKWLTDQVTTNPIWWHYLVVVIPNKVNYTDTAFLWIDGGHNDQSPPTIEDEHTLFMVFMAETTGSVAATIKQIPNEPIVFQDDPTHKKRTEDAIIAWTWKKFLENGSNPEILLRLPMTKAVMRGMDTISSFVKNLTGTGIDKFVIAGGSKRGWTTWTVGAVDKRVVGMAPTVMDLLNLQQNLHHHYRSLGGWTFAFEDYYAVNITKDLDNPNIPLMEAVIDPLVYNDRYTMPKFVVTSGGDEFFLIDDSHYYWDQLKEPKFMRIIPNAEHSLKYHQIGYELSVRSFYLNILEKASYPQITWQRTQTGTGGKITVKTSRPPHTVIVYHAKTTDAKRRDYRLFIKSPNNDEPYPHPVVWFEGSPRKISDTEYEAVMDRPESGWIAFFIQLTFDGVNDSELEFTTEACIVPDTFPFPDCHGDSCYGTLV